MPNKEIIIKPQLLTKEILCDLEKRSLIRTLRPSNKIKSNSVSDCCETIYKSHPKHGGHTLLCVRKNVTEIVFTTHTDNEDVIFINAGKGVYKPLYLLFGLLPYEEMEKKAHAMELRNSDFVALKVEFNQPETAVFTILKGTVHCEITGDGPGESPLFYVTEPTNMKMNVCHFSPISFVLGYNNHN